MVGCLTCLSPTVCTACNVTGTPQYLLNTTDNHCYLCTLSFCITCQTLTACSVCQTGYFINSTTGLCQICPSGCTNCTQGTCYNCNYLLNYILINGSCFLCTGGLLANPITSQCSSCSNVLPNCVTCLTYNTCSLCNLTNAYYNIGTSCYYCDPTLNKFVNATANTC